MRQQCYTTTGGEWTSFELYSSPGASFRDCDETKRAHNGGTRLFSQALQTVGFQSWTTVLQTGTLLFALILSSK